MLPEGRILNKTHPDSCPAGQSGLNWPMESLQTFVVVSHDINNLTAALLTIQQLPRPLLLLSAAPRGACQKSVYSNTESKDKQRALVLCCHLAVASALQGFSARRAPLQFPQKCYLFIYLFSQVSPLVNLSASFPHPRPQGQVLVISFTLTPSNLP